MKKKIIILFIIILLIICSLMLPIKGQTIASYYPMIEIKVPVIKQEPQGCAIASMASIEAYFMQENGGNYASSQLYKMIKNTNNAGILAYWARIGYTPIKLSNEKSYLNYIYNELASGYPVICYRNSTHYSVVYGYNGSKTKLSLSGFMVADVAQGVKTYTNLKTWIGNYKTNYELVVRRNGYTKASSLVKDVKFAISHPSKMMKKGASEEIRGTITSPTTLKSIKAGIYDKNNQKVYEVSKAINTKCYTISALDSSLLFSKLGKGNYYYRIVVVDEKKKQSKYEYEFRVVDSIEYRVSSYSQFYDINVSSWYYQTIEEMKILGYINGYNDNYFGPDDYFTRGMAAVVLYNMSKQKVSYQKVFDDVTSNQYYSEAITWCYQNKIIRGYDDGLFHPDDYITREQLVVMIRNYYQKNLKMNGKLTINLSIFKDYKKISTYAKSAMAWAVGANIISGNNQKQLEPQRNATRSEAAKLYLLLDKLS